MRRSRARPFAVACAAAAVTTTLASPGAHEPATERGGAVALLTSSAPVPTTVPGPALRPRPPRVLTLGWIGDTTPGSSYGLPPGRGRALFAPLRRQLRRPDLMLANLEGTYSTPGPSKCDHTDNPACFTFQAPPAHAAALAWSGIDLVNVANNHAYDFLDRGQRQTRAALAAHGVAYTGTPGQVARLRVRGVRVAVVGFSPYWWSPSVNDLPAAARLVRRADRGADIVVVLFHAGAEGADQLRTPWGPETDYGEPRGDPRAFARTVVVAGADLVLGSGPHVVRGIQRLRGRLIAHSLGNFGGWGSFQRAGVLGLSGLLTVRIDASGAVRGGHWLSLRQQDPGYPVPDPSHASAALVARLSAADFHRRWTIGARGRLTHPAGR